MYASVSLKNICVLFGSQCQNQLPCVDLGLRTLKIVMTIPHISLVMCVGVIAQPCRRPTLKTESKLSLWHPKETFNIFVLPNLLPDNTSITDTFLSSIFV